ncbi:MAG: mucoidy inhibitor [Xanthobacteraceae bacterium]|nr:mucoidy inhibitor [Xanthobacteraceae bacterium]
MHRLAILARSCAVVSGLMAGTAIVVLPASAAEIEAASKIDQVTVYPDGATVTRTVRLDLPAGDTTLLLRDFPLSLDPASLRVEGEGRLTIGAVDSRPPRPQPPANRPDIDKRIEALRDERGTLDGAIASAQARRKFAERFAESAPAGIGEKGEARPLAEWRAAFAAVAEEVATADNAIRDARQKQRDLDRDIARLESERNATPPRKLEVRIDLNAGAAAPAILRVSYSVRGARWAPLYDARLDTGAKDKKPALELIRRAEISQSTGEDWDDVSLGVSTVRTAKGGSAPELSPLAVRYPEPPRPMAGGVSRDRLGPPPPAAPQMAARSMTKAESAPAPEQEAVAETGGFQVVFRIPGRVSVPAQQGAKALRIATATIAPDLMVRAVPALDDTAFLEAAFKQPEEAPLLPGRVAIYRDGVFVGRSQMALAAKDETVRLGFGADEKVKIVRTTVRRAEGTAGLIGSSKTEEREFKTVVRNGHDFPIKVSLEDQLPVSEAEDIVVETLPVTTTPTAQNLRDRRGVLEWAFDAKPAEVREVKFGWRVRWPKDKSVVFGPAAP